MADAESKQRICLIAVDGSKHAEIALQCEYHWKSINFIYLFLTLNDILIILRVIHAYYIP